MQYLLKKNFTLLFLLPLFFLFACHSSPKKREKMILRIAFSEQPPTADPRKGGETLSSSLQFMIFEGLVRMTKDSSTSPGIAEEIITSDDRTSYTFHLRDAKWSNGKKVKAKDFEMAWKEMVKPEFACPNANLLYPIKNAKKIKMGELPIDKLGVISIDENILRVDLEGPTPYFLELIAFCVFSPIPYDIVKENPNWPIGSKEIVSNGPFKIKKWKQGRGITLEKNPFYWDAENVKLDEIEAYFIDSEITALQMYEKGEIDFLGPPLINLPLDSMPTLAQKADLHTNPLGATTFCAFNMEHFPFYNLNIRKAFSLAIHRQEIVDHITQMHETVATGAIPPILKQNITNTYFQDGDKEKALYYLNKGLSELGKKKEEIKELTLIYIIGNPYQKIAQALQQQWEQALGLKVNLESYTFKVFLDKLNRRDYTFALSLWIAQYNDLMNIFDRFKFKENPKNYPGWENARYIHLLNQSMECKGKKQRLEILERAEKIFIEEMPISPIFHWNQIYLQKPYLKDVHISPISSIHFGMAYIDQKERKERK